MHSGEHLALAATATAVELELIRTRMRGTVAMLDRFIAERQHLRALPDPEPAAEQYSTRRSMLLF